MDLEDEERGVMDQLTARLLQTQVGDRRNFRSVDVHSPRHHVSDHRAVVAIIYAGSRRRMVSYKRRRCRFPLWLSKTGPCTHTHSEHIVEELKLACEPPPPQERRENKWI